MTSNTAFTFNQSALSSALSAVGGQSHQAGPASAMSAAPNNQVTVVVPYWQRFFSSMGSAAKDALKISAALAAALMAVIKAIIRRIASLFNFSQAEQENTADATAQALSTDAPDADAMGPSTALIGDANLATPMMQAIDDELAQLAEKVMPLLNRTPKDKDYMDEGGAIILQQELILVGEFISKTTESVTQKEKALDILRQAISDSINKSASSHDLPMRDEVGIAEFVAKNPTDPQCMAISRLAAEIKSDRAQIEAAQNSFVEICATAKSLGDDSQAYFVARRLMDKFAFTAVAERVEAIQASLLNKSKETSPTGPILVENNVTADKAHSQTEKIDKNKKVVRISRSERFKGPDDGPSETGTSSEGYERQR